ncbi:unnamed protein product, partial [Cylicostephanus goldi]
MTSPAIIGDSVGDFFDVDLTGRTFLITGTTSGIGTETARALALKGGHVVMANRNIVQSDALKERILAEKPDAKIDMIMCDLSSLQSVQTAANEPIHALILNAGVFSPVQKTTIDGMESSFGVNHVAHQYLVRELLPVLRQSHARIVIVSSHAHKHTGVRSVSLILCVFKAVQCSHGYEASSRRKQEWYLCIYATSWNDDRHRYLAKLRSSREILECGLKT